MNFRPLVAAMAAGSLLLGNVAAFGEPDPQVLEQKERDLQRAIRTGGDPRPANATAPAYRNDARPQQRNDAPPQQRNDRYYHRDASQDSRYDPRQDSRYDPRYYQRWDSDQRRYMPADHSGGDWRGRGAGPEHNWYRGSYVPREYRGRHYVVDDWRGHHLYAPPSGYQWVQAPGGDYLLVAVATGLIASILLNQ